MLDMNLIRKDADAVRTNLQRRGNQEYMEMLEDVIELDEKWRKAQSELEELRAKKNRITQKIQDEGASNDLIEEAKELGEHVDAMEDEVDHLKPKRDEELKKIPNILHDSVPQGDSDEDNVEVRIWGEPAVPEFDMEPHGEFLEEQGLADFEKSAEVAGRGFYYLKGDLALLDYALQNFAMNLLVEKGFTPVEPPHMLRRKPYEGVTDLDDFENVMYKIEDEDLYLIATSEHSLAAMLMDEVVGEEKLPVRLAGISPCFRKEIGAHGIDTRGIFRVHQFNKVEQFVFCRPEDSWDIHEELLANAEEVFQALELPYRVVNVCTGDIGTIAAKKYDIEVWSPRQEEYTEVVSCSNCTDYQARRLNVRYGKYGGEKELVHTLNSTAIATSRAMVAIVENFQMEDGFVEIPEALRPYMNGQKVLNPVEKVTE